MWARPLGGVAILAVLLWRLGTGPFLGGLRLVEGSALLAAFGLGVLTIVCAAWRWTLVARGLGVRLPLAVAVPQYYRSVFLNTTLPGGVLGDVHRAVGHGREVGDVSRGVRAVVWERSAGQAVQGVIAIAVLFVFASPLRPHMPALTAAVAAAGLSVLLAAGVLSRYGGRSSDLLRTGPLRTGLAWCGRVLSTAKTDIRDGLLAPRTWFGIVLASALTVVGHLATFLLAARTAGATAPLVQLLPLTLLALLAMGLPLNIGGWGPREGVAAWAFGAAGLTAAQGVSTAVVYGVLVLVASLPGAAVLAVPRIARLRRTRPLRVARSHDSGDCAAGSGALSVSLTREPVRRRNLHPCGRA